MSTNNDILIWAEQRNGRLMDVSLQILGKARELAEEMGGKAVAVLLGNDIDGLAEELRAYGADEVYLISDPQLSHYQSDAYTRLISELIEKAKPEIMLLGATAIGMDLAPSIAARVKTGLTAHCSGLFIDKIEGQPKLIASVPGFGGGISVNISCPKRIPQMVTVSSGVAEKPSRSEGRKGEVIRVNVELNKDDFRAKTIEIFEEQPEGIPIDKADIVVAGGYGMKSAGGFDLLKELADLLGAAVGGTRRAVEEGWIPESSMIGVSGKIISPKLLISFGASGANHWTAGFVGANKVLAVDSDAEAPVFNVCDIGIVDDLNEVIPIMIKKIKETLMKVDS